MKKIVLLIVLIVMILQASGTEPSPWQFRWGFSTSFRSFEPDSFKLNSILTGFQWYGSRKMNNAMLNNTRAGAKYDHETDSIYSTLQLIHQPTWIDNGYYMPGYWHSVFMQYEPTLPLTQSNLGSILRPADSSNPVFGFLYRRGTILSLPSDINYSRLILTRADKPSYGGDVVLDSIWPQPNFQTVDWADFIKPGQTDRYLGKKWYLTINLRRLNPDTDTTQDDSVVISIKLPYKLGNDSTGYIKFNKLPVNHPDSVEHLNYFEERGYAQLLQDVSPIDSIKITRKMIPTLKPYDDITISAEFITATNENNILLYNPPFINDNDIVPITDINITVKYFGRLDIAVDNIMIENLNAHILLRGEVDSLGANPDDSIAWQDRRGFKEYHTDPDEDPDDPHIEQINTIKDIIQTSLDTIKIKSDNWSDANIFRFYYQDTESDKFYWWGPLRYCNKFSNGLFITRDKPQHPELYSHYTKCPNRWIGLLYSDDDILMPAPYLRRGLQNWETMGLKWGYYGNTNYLHFPDSLNSDYETHLFNSVTLDDMKNDSIYFNVILGGTKVLQQVWEKSQYLTFLDSTSKNYKLIFSNQPWFYYNLLYNVSLEDSNITYMYYRAKTSEELRLLLHSSMIKGCKGYLSDGDNNDTLPNFGTGQMGLGNNEYLSSTVTIDKDTVGTDFIDSYNHTWDAYKFTNFGELSDTMGVHPDRIYIGTKSMRMELFKFNSLNRAIDSTLMRLRLLAILSKGYRCWYRENSVGIGNDSLLTKYISLDSNRTYTKKIYDPWSGSPQIQRESYDSSFYDITLLRDESDTSQNMQIYYLGILNKRTDPLFLYKYDSDTTMCFATSPEFDQYVEEGGYAYPYKGTANGRWHDSKWWQDKWWRRQGSREITIGFNSKLLLQPPEDYSLLKITELGYDNVTFNNQPWRDPKYYHLIDTIIGQDGSLKVRLLSGQSKILRVEILPPPPKIYANLDYSNQRKLIAFPVDSADTYAYDSIRYHLVYHARVDDTMRVFYRRSMPVTGKTENAPQENIIWPPSVADSLCLSLYYKSDCTSETINRACDCAYPSIVVRKDSASVNRAFVVYTCIDNNSLVLVEAKINVDNSTASFETPKIIQRISGWNIDKWGTPMINAAADGNFYTWSDSTEGIGIGFKSTMTYCFERDDRKYVRFDQYQTAIHPSLNSYSRINQNENQCALVWQEEFGIPNPPPMPPTFQSEICHARILWNNWGLSLSEFNLISPLNYVSFNNDSTIMRVLNFPTGSNHSNLPVVYRGLDGTLNDDFDRITWYDQRDIGVLCGDNPPVAGYLSAIRYMAVDSKYTPPNDTNTISVPRKIIGGFRNPDLTFGTFEGTTSNNSEKAMILEFNSYNSCVENDNENLVIWHIPHSFITFLAGSSFSPGSLTYAKQLSGNGYLSHLAARQFQDGPEDWWKNRRVFMESDSTLNDSLKTSAQAFYKGKRGKVAIPFIGFYNYYASSFVSPFYIDGELIRFDVKDMFKTDCRDCRGTIIPDTIKTDWFRVTEANNLDYFIKGFETENVEMLLERKSNRQTVRVNVPRLSDTIMIPIRNLLINGRNNEYRLLFTKLDRFNYYTENLIIMEDPFEPIFRKQGGFDNIIDLGETEYSDPNDYLSIYPNPAEDKIFVTISKPGAGQCRIELISTLGQVVHTGSANINSSTEINIQGISPGLYIIRAFLPNGEVLQNSFVLSR